MSQENWRLRQEVEKKYRMSVLAVSNEFVEHGVAVFVPYPHTVCEAFEQDHF